MKFFPLYFHSELVSYHWLFFFSSLRPLEDRPLAFWSCIKEEMGGEKALLILRFVWLKHRGQKNTSGVRCWRGSRLSSVSATEGRRKKREKKGVMHLSLESCICPLPSIISPYNCVVLGVNKAPFSPTGDKPSIDTLSGSFSSYSARPVTPSCWRHSPADLFLHETALFSVVIRSSC